MIFPVWSEVQSCRKYIQWKERRKEYQMKPQIFLTNDLKQCYLYKERFPSETFWELLISRNNTAIVNFGLNGRNIFVTNSLHLSLNQQMLKKCVSELKKKINFFCHTFFHVPTHKEVSNVPPRWGPKKATHALIKLLTLW